MATVHGIRAGGESVAQPLLIHDVVDTSFIERYNVIFSKHMVIVEQTFHAFCEQAVTLRRCGRDVFYLAQFYSWSSRDVTVIVTDHLLLAEVSRDRNLATPFSDDLDGTS